MKLQIKFKFTDPDTLKEISRSKTFSNVNELATNDDLILFSKAYLGLTDIKEYKIIKISSEELTTME